MCAYTEAVKFYVDYIWETRIEWGTSVLDIKNEMYDMPKFISTVGISVTTDLSGRALKLASSQALGIVASSINKIKKIQYKRDMCLSDGKIDRAQKYHETIKKILASKPTVENLQATLNSTCCTFVETKSGEFNGFLKLMCLGKKFGHIYIPVKFHRHTNSLKSKGFNQKTSWFVCVDRVVSIWEKIVVPKKTGNKVGGDQGITTCLTLSDGQTTLSDNHGHTLSSIMTRLSKRQKGSKNFRKAQAHRKNYINYSINQLNFDNIKELGYEDVKNIRYGKGSNRFMQSWTFTEIRDKIESRCEVEGVLLTKQGSVYRSQRCSSCSHVHSSSRVKKVYQCVHCGFTLDADLNGAKNHEIDLPPIPYSMIHLKLNKVGFFWKEEGLFNLDGKEFTVPSANKT